jgi:hypothetical protein
VNLPDARAKALIKAGYATAVVPPQAVVAPDAWPADEPKGGPETATNTPATETAAKAPASEASRPVPPKK